MLKSRLKHVLAAVAISTGAATVAVAPVAPVHAAPGSPSTTPTYTVKSGDYLTGIAVKLGVRLRDLLAANDLRIDSVIHPGMTLVVPAGGSVPGGTSSNGSGSTPTAALTYTVKSGDYLSGIALTLKVRLADLLTLNRLTTASIIHPGMTLQVPPGAVVPTAPTAPAGSTGSSGSTNQAPAVGSDGTLAYTVVAGDSLIRIASRTKVTLSSLLTANKLTTSSLIYPGMRLTIPAGGSLPAASQPSPPPTAPAATAPAATTAGTASANTSAAANPQIAAVVDFALAQKGKPYAFNTAGPDTYDCSGLTLAAYRQIGIRLPHYSGFQARYGEAVDWTTTTIQPGDLVFLESTPGSGVINHVGIAVSSTQYIHAPRSGDVVRVGTIPMHRVVSVRRLIAG